MLRHKIDEKVLSKKYLPACTFISCIRSAVVAIEAGTHQESDYLRDRGHTLTIHQSTVIYANVVQPTYGLDTQVQRIIPLLAIVCILIYSCISSCVLRLSQ